MGILRELKQNFKMGSALLRLIYINVALFIIINLISLLVSLLGEVEIWKVWYMKFLFLPSNLSDLITHPWTLVTYMFMHADIWHILFNMLWLYWLGQIFLLYLNGRQLVTLYFLGGLSGAFLYLLVYNVFPSLELNRFGSLLVGASASVMAIVFAISTLVPNFMINLFIIGPVRLKFIALATVIIDIISIQYSNAGGHIAHLGGAVLGYFFGLKMRKGSDITTWFTKITYPKINLFHKKKGIHLMYRRPPVNDYEYNKQKVEIQKELDRILDKIAQSGYDSLTKSEKEFLHKGGKI